MTQALTTTQPIIPGMIPLDQAPQSLIPSDPLEVKAHQNAQIPRIEVWKYNGKNGKLKERKTEDIVDHMYLTILDYDHPRGLWHVKNKNNPWHDRLDTIGFPKDTPICRARGLNVKPTWHPDVDKLSRVKNFLTKSGAHDCGSCRLKDWIRMPEGQDDLPPLCEATRIIIGIRYVEGRPPYPVMIEISGQNSAESLDMKLKALSKGGQYSWLNYCFRLDKEEFTAQNGARYQKTILEPIGYNPPERLEWLQQQRSIYVLTQDKNSPDRDESFTGNDFVPGQNDQGSHEEFTQRAQEEFKGAPEPEDYGYDGDGQVSEDYEPPEYDPETGEIVDDIPL